MTESASASEGSVANSRELPPFIVALYQMLMDTRNADICCWANQPQNSGEKQRFRVKSSTRLANEILPQFFRHTKLTSFMRQVSQAIIVFITCMHAHTCTYKS